MALRKYLDRISRWLSASHPKVRAAAAHDLGQVAYGLRFAVRRLTACLDKGQDPQSRLEAARALGAIGPLARDAVPDLLTHLDDADDAFRLAVIGAMGGIAPVSQNAIPKLIQLTRDKNVLIRRRSIGALGRFGPEAREAIPALIIALNDPDPGEFRKESSVRTCALTTLQRIGREARAAATALFELQKSDDVLLKGKALETLSTILPKDPKLVPYLVEVLRASEYPLMRASAARALGTLGPAAKEAVPDLIKALQANDLPEGELAQRAPVCIVHALGEIGPAARAAIPLLEPLTKSRDEVLNGAATEARKSIRSAR